MHHSKHKHANSLSAYGVAASVSTSHSVTPRLQTSVCCENTRLDSVSGDIQRVGSDCELLNGSRPVALSLHMLRLVSSTFDLRNNELKCEFANVFFFFLEIFFDNGKKILF